MTKKEKVFKGLTHHFECSMFDRCTDCPYYEYNAPGFQCRDELLFDAFSLLKVN